MFLFKQIEKRHEMLIHLFSIIPSLFSVIYNFGRIFFQAEPIGQARIHAIQ